MPAAAKILAEKGLAATDVAGSGKDGPRDQGRRPGRCEAQGGCGSPVAVPASPAVAKPLPGAVAAPVAPNLGERPECACP